MARVSLIFGCAAGVLSGVVACATGTGSVPSQETVGSPQKALARQDPAADSALRAAADSAQEAPTKQKAAGIYLNVRHSHPETSAGQEALYRAGLLYFDAADYASARKAFNELLFENPLFEKAAEARRKLGLASLELGQYRDAYQALFPLMDKAQGEERGRLLDATERAAEGAYLYGNALKLVLQAAQEAKTAEEQSRALERVTELVEGKVPFTEVAKAANEMAPNHPAWPLLTFKLARIYYHLRDWDRLKETLQRFLAQVPNHPFAPEAQRLLLRAQETGGPVQPKRVGIVLPLSGRYQPFGEAVLRGVKLALDGSDVELVVKDSKGDVNLAGKAVEDLALDGQAIAIIGPILGDESKRAALASEELRIPILTLTRTEGITEIGPHVFRNMLTNSAQAQALAEYGAKVLGIKNWALLYPQIPYGEELANIFWDDLEKLGATVRGAETYAYDQTTFTGEAKKLVGRYYLEDRQDFVDRQKEIHESDLDPFRKRKALEKAKSKLDPVVDFDAIFLPADWRQVGLIAPALAVEDIITNVCNPKDLERLKKTTGKSDLKTVTLFGSNAWSSPKGRTNVPELVERGGKFVFCSIYVDSFFADSERSGTRKFVQAFLSTHKDLGREPNALEAAGYDAGGMFRRVVSKFRPRSRDAFRAALSTLKDFDGAQGRTFVDEHREGVKPLFFLSIDSDGVHEITPTAKAGS